MRKLLLLFLFIDTVLAAPAQKADTAKYFEGYIDYKTEFTSLMKGISDNEVKVRVGSLLRIYYTEFAFKWVFLDETGHIISYETSDLNKNINYSWSNTNPDTIYTFNLSSEKRLETDSIIEEGMARINNCNCRVLNIYTKLKYENPVFSVPGHYKHFFCPDLKINPVPYKDLREMKWNEIIANQKSVAIKMISKFEGSVIGDFTAINIVHQKVDKSIFLIDKLKIIKPTFVD